MSKQIIRKVLSEMFSGRIQEEDNDKPGADNIKQSEEKAGYSGLYQRVQDKLKDDRINHAAIMRDLNWEGDDNTNRSLFEKKLKRSKNDSGGVYEFTKEELEEILSSIETIGKN